jgi:hypothetical protein
MIQKDKCYCFKCRKYVDYIIEEIEIVSTYNEITIKYMGKEVTCVVCGGLVSKREITNENINKGHKLFKEELIKLESGNNCGTNKT